MGIELAAQLRRWHLVRGTHQVLWVGGCLQEGDPLRPNREFRVESERRKPKKDGWSALESPQGEVRIGASEGALPCGK